MLPENRIDDFTTARQDDALETRVIDPGRLPLQLLGDPERRAWIR